MLSFLRSYTKNLSLPEGSSISMRKQILVLKFFCFAKDLAVVALVARRVRYAAGFALFVVLVLTENEAAFLCQYGLVNSSRHRQMIAEKKRGFMPERLYGTKSILIASFHRGLSSAIVKNYQNLMLCSGGAFINSASALKMPGNWRSSGVMIVKKHGDLGHFFRLQLFRISL
jgi:hypothetical protein